LKKKKNLSSASITGQPYTVIGRVVAFTLFYMISSEDKIKRSFIKGYFKNFYL